MVPHPTWTTARFVKILLVLLMHLHVVRNLYARVYLKEHPATTTAEFKKIWDTIDPTIAAVSFVVALNNLVILI